MAIVKINAIEVPEGRGPELEQRFANRAGAVEDAPGFLSYELLRPVEGETRYFVLTRWESEEAFQTWRNSEDFARGHRQAAGDRSEQPVATGSSVLAFEVVESVGLPTTTA